MDPKDIPAFPGVDSEWDHEEKQWRTVSTSGMTLRDWFAGKAVQGLLAQSMGSAGGMDPALGAPIAYQWADAMLKAR